MVDELLHHLRVGCHPAHDLAGLPRVEITDGQLLEVAVHILAQSEDELLAQDVHHVAPRERQQTVQAVDRRQQQREDHKEADAGLRCAGGQDDVIGDAPVEQRRDQSHQPEPDVGGDSQRQSGAVRPEILQEPQERRPPVPGHVPVVHQSPSYHVRAKTGRAGRHAFAAGSANAAGPHRPMKKPPEALRRRLLKMAPRVQPS